MIASRIRLTQSALKWCVAMLLPLLVPTSPLVEVKAKETYETSLIYFMLQSAKTDWDRQSAWAVAETIRGESNKYSLDPMLVLAIIRVESEFRPRAVSIYGARGLMQLLPGTAHALAGETAMERWEGEKSLDDPIVNIKLGVFYLGYLKEKFGDLKIALIAYNQGPTWVQKRIEGKMSLPLEYVQKVLSTSRGYREQSLAQERDKI